VQIYSLTLFKKFPIDFWKSNIALDTKPFHTAELGAVWANKKECLHLANQQLPDYTWYTWVDAGCIRSEAYKPFCDNFGLRHSFSPGVYLQLLNDIPADKHLFNYDDCYVAGAIIMAHKDYIHTLVKSYDTMIQTYVSKNYSAIMDQYILASLTQTEPYIHTVNYKTLDQNFKEICINDWFFFLQYI
jgi:hypothetical protein